MNPRRRDDARKGVQVAGSDLNTKNKNTCGEGGERDGWFSVRPL